MNFNLLDQVPKFDGFYSLDLNRFFDVFKRVYFTTNEASKLKDFVGISHISNPTNAVDWIARNTSLPLVTAGQKPIFADADGTLAGFLGEGFDPAHEVYLPREARGALEATEAAGCHIELVDFSSRRLRINVETERASLVVIAQAFYPAWHAYVDGRFTTLWRANHAFQAVQVPAGKHLLTLAYEDQAFALGAATSTFSLLACGA